MRRLIILAVMLTILLPNVANTETMGDYLAKEWLINAYTRCGTERLSLRRAAMCEHKWEVLGPGMKGCPKCASIATFVGGEWQVTFCDGIYVGPDPLEYPETYNLGPVR